MWGPHSFHHKTPVLHITHNHDLVSSVMSIQHVPHTYTFYTSFHTLPAHSLPSPATPSHSTGSAEEVGRNILIADITFGRLFAA